MEQHEKETSELKQVNESKVKKLEEALKQLYSNIEREMGEVEKSKSEHSRESRENDQK